MRPRGATGVWELFVPEVGPGTRYKYQVVATSGDHVEKADPFARSAEVRPMTASVVPTASAFHWEDADWLAGRQTAQAGDAALSIYEVHLGSWKRGRHNEWLGYRDLADTLLPYVQDLGFTHVELMPLTEHPLDQSWGYQPLGFFAPTSRFGSADDLRYFVDRAHALGLGVLLDWVPGHFATDAHGLVAFDGTPLFEPADPRQARHPDWGTLVFDHGKPQVQSFLISSALRWIEDFHFDGLRIDAVASMLYLDYSRGEGEWVPNEAGGNENLGAVAFLRHLNDALHQESPGVVTMAEESTAWDGVSRPTSEGGLGFDQKWNMGWMNDTLRFMAEDPVHRRFHFDRITFSIVYAWSERFLLPLSHDEVVHGKRSLINKMPGDDGEKFANLRLLLAYQWMHPGKKLLFMGGELAQWAEWNADGQIDWALEGFDYHVGMRRLVRDLNRLYRSEPNLHRTDFRPGGFEWLDHEDVDGVTLSFMRGEPGGEDPILVALNFTPVPRQDFVIPTPEDGRYRVVLNSDDPVYGGEGLPVPPLVDSRSVPTHGRAHRVTLPLPGFSVLILKRDPA
jgi:1,4-alpha-glucan branching enzyme